MTALSCRFNGEDCGLWRWSEGTLASTYQKYSYFKGFSLQFLSTAFFSFGYFHIPHDMEPEKIGLELSLVFRIYDKNIGCFIPVHCRYEVQ